MRNRREDRRADRRESRRNLRSQEEKELNNKTEKKGHFARGKYYLVWILTAIILLGIFTSYLRVEEKVQDYQETINDLNSEIKDLKKNNKLLEEQMENVNSDEYIERMARERLGMVKEGEILLKQSDSTAEESSTEKKSKEEKSTEKKSKEEKSTEKKSK